MLAKPAVQPCLAATDTTAKKVKFLINATSAEPAVQADAKPISDAPKHIDNYM
jgi:hypothetical protein